MDSVDAFQTAPGATAQAVERRRQLNILRGQLDIERSSFIPHWRDLGDYILPRRPRFFITDRNRGDRRNLKIIDSTATLAARTLRSGMMTGMTSPARPWFRLMTQDPALSQMEDVKDWLHEVGDRMAMAFLRSNLYNALPTVYGDIGTFGTSAMLVEEDFKTVSRFYVMPIGSYFLMQDENGRINGIFREFGMTVWQIVEKFAARKPNGDIIWDNFSPRVKNMWDSKLYQTWIDVCHVVQPNPDFDPSKLHPKFKKFASLYFERGSYSSASGPNGYDVGENTGFLRESGFDLFPILCPRWEVTGEDVYGTECPGMTALGDIKQLQMQEKRGAQAIEKMVNPPLVGPPELQTKKVTVLPGDVNYVVERDGQKGLRPLYEINPRIQELEAKEQQGRGRIQRAFYEDLFLMLSEMDRRQITATEVNERHEEKLLALGPVLEQLNQDLLDPLIDIQFDIMLRQGLIPPPPQALQGQPLRVEYISIMAQAQKLVSVTAIEKFTAFVGQLAQANPEAMDKMDGDKTVDVYGDLWSVPPGIVRSDEEVQAMREQRAQQKQAEAQAAQTASATTSAKNLSETKLDDNNALSALIQAAKAGQLVPQGAA